MLRAPGEPYRREDQGDGADDDVLDVGEAAPAGVVREEVGGARPVRTYLLQALPEDPQAHDPAYQHRDRADDGDDGHHTGTAGEFEYGDQVVALAVGGGRRQLAHENEYGVDDEQDPADGHRP